MNLPSVQSVTWATITAPTGIQQEANSINENMVAWIKEQAKIEHMNLRQIVAHDWLNPATGQGSPNGLRILSQKGMEVVIQNIDDWLFRVKNLYENEIKKLREEFLRARKSSNPKLAQRALNVEQSVRPTFAGPLSGRGRYGGRPPFTPSTPHRQQSRGIGYLNPTPYPNIGQGGSFFRGRGRQPGSRGLLERPQWEMLATQIVTWHVVLSRAPG